MGLDGSGSLFSCQAAQGPAGSGVDPQDRPELHPVCAAATLALFLVPTGIIPAFPHTLAQHIKSMCGSIRSKDHGIHFGSLAHSTGWECEQGGRSALMTGSLCLLAEGEL